MIPFKNKYGTRAAGGGGRWAGVVGDYLRGRLPFLFRRPHTIQHHNIIIMQQQHSCCWLWLYWGEKGEVGAPLKFKNSTHGQARSYQHQRWNSWAHLSTFSFSFFPLFFNPRLKWCPAEIKDRFGDVYISLSITGNESQSGTSITITSHQLQHHQPPPP